MDKPELPELPPPDGSVNFGYGDQPAWARWNLQEYAKRHGAACYAAGMAKAAGIADDIAVKHQQEDGAYPAGKKAGAFESAEAIRAAIQKE